MERKRRVAKLRTWEHLLLGGLSGAARPSLTLPAFTCAVLFIAELARTVEVHAGSGGVGSSAWQLVCLCMQPQHVSAFSGHSFNFRSKLDSCQIVIERGGKAAAGPRLTLKPCCAGATAASATMPLDFAKTVLQTGGTQPIQHVFANAIRDKGVGGLFAGMVRTDQFHAACPAVLTCSMVALYSAQLCFAVAARYAQVLCTRSGDASL